MKVAEKGYTLEVVSWENDGDNYNTTNNTYQNKELAIAMRDMCTSLFRSENNGDGGIGNSSGSNHDENIVEYFKKNEILLKDLDIEDDDDILDACREYTGDLMGYSEWYDFRVCESATLTYLKEDVIADIIN